MRIESKAGNTHADRAWKIYQRYRNNIQRRKSWADEYNKALAIENTNYDGARSILNKANSRQYSQSTYMGVNAG